MCEKIETKKGGSERGGQSNATPDHEKGARDQDFQKLSQVGDPKCTEKETPGDRGGSPGDSRDFWQKDSEGIFRSNWFEDSTREIGESDSIP